MTTTSKAAMRRRKDARRSNQLNASEIRWQLLLLMLTFAGLDQATKWLANTALRPELSVPVIPKVFQWTLTYNTGAAFSLFHQVPNLLTAFSTLLFLALAAYSFLPVRSQNVENWALGLLLGGALGNLLDRLFNGRVTDFVDFVLIHYPVFNGADTFIFFGALLLIASHLFGNDAKGNHIRKKTG